MTISKFIPKSFLLFILVVAPLFIACKDKESTAEQTTEAVQEASLEQKKNALNNVVPANNANSNSNSAAGGMNPAHGQPGHRCDIAVGAPLNGASATPSATPVQANSTPVKVGEGLNPAHGQPGHRCDIKVGDPL